MTYFVNAKQVEIEAVQVDDAHEFALKLRFRAVDVGIVLLCRRTRIKPNSDPPAS